jgi:hypothetical protein
LTKIQEKAAKKSKEVCKQNRLSIIHLKQEIQNQIQIHYSFTLIVRLITADTTQVFVFSE